MERINTSVVNPHLRTGDSGDVRRIQQGAVIPQAQYQFDDDVFFYIINVLITILIGLMFYVCFWVSRHWWCSLLCCSKKNKVAPNDKKTSKGVVPQSELPMSLTERRIFVLDRIRIKRPKRRSSLFSLTSSLMNRRRSSPSLLVELDNEACHTGDVQETPQLRLREPVRELTTVDPTRDDDDIIADNTHTIQQKSPSLRNKTNRHNIVPRFIYHIIQCLFKPNLNDDKPSLCHLCLHEFLDSDEICSSHNMQCPHVFHSECIVEWLMDTDRCPCCRRNYLIITPPGVTNKPEDSEDTTPPISTVRGCTIASDVVSEISSWDGDERSPPSRHRAAYDMPPLPSMKVSLMRRSPSHDDEDDSSGEIREGGGNVNRRSSMESLAL